MDKMELGIPPELAGQRLDSALSALLPDRSRAGLQKLITQGGALLNGVPAVKSTRVAPGDVLSLTLPDPVRLRVEAENIPLDILFEDEQLLVVNKPKGMVVHPAPGNYTGTLVNALLYHCRGNLSGINGVIRPGIVHRIDKDTSGLLMVAKTDLAHRALASQIAAHSFLREYEAVVYGGFHEDVGQVDAPIGRHPLERKRMAVTEKHSRPARTHYEVIGRYEGFTHLRLRLETGRTHQIRVHMAYLGHPVAGDPVYGPKKVLAGLGGQCLHARVIGFRHPDGGEWMEFSAPLPDYFTGFLGKQRAL